MNTKRAPRDLRLDAIRGLLLVFMAGVHVPTPLSVRLQDPLGFMSAAEGFIFLSACLAGFVYGRTYWQGGWRAMSRRVWNRTEKIYYLHLAVLVPVVLFAWAFAGRIQPLANHFHDFLVHPWCALALIPLLLQQPPLFDILPLYIIFLGATPWLLAIARRRGWGILLALSMLGWLAVQLNVGAHLAIRHPRWLPLSLGAFNLLAWQLVWVGGLALGESALRGPLLAGRWRTGVGVASGFVVLAGFLGRHGFIALNPDWFLWMDKWTLGPLRLLNFAAWVGLLLAWKPRVPARPLAPLALLGRNSLAVFSFHLPLVVVASTLVQSIRFSHAGQVALGVLVIAALFPWAAWLEYRARSGQSSAAPEMKSGLMNSLIKFVRRQPVTSVPR